MSAPSVRPGRCRFALSPPRHFLYPALLLLLTESPAYGYRLAAALPELGLGQIDRPSVYRALADLVADGLLGIHEDTPAAGSTRRVYDLTDDGRAVLEAWMSVIAEEQACLGNVLDRYWYATLAAVAPRERRPPLPPPAPGAGRAASFSVRPGHSHLTVEARSSVGPIAFDTGGLAGTIRATVGDGLLDPDRAVTAHLEVELGGLRSGNALYDAELARRAQARRFPLVAVELRSVSRRGVGNSYRVAGDVTIHGVTRRLDGTVVATVQSLPGPTGGTAGPLRLTAVGEHVLDIRRFDLEPPSMPLLRIYPEVRLHLHLEADTDPGDPAASPT